MYRQSGGCDRENICAKCGYIEKESLKSGPQYRCSLHRTITGENHIWKDSYMACKSFQPKAVRPKKQSTKSKTSPKLTESKSGQLSFL